MAKKASLFSGGSRAAAAKIAKAKNQTKIETRVDISPEAISQRVAQRAVLPQHSLVFTCNGYENRVAKSIEYDFTQLGIDFPHHSALINQLLVGVALILDSRKSTKTIRTAYTAFQKFVKYLNSPKKICNSDVKSVADIDTFVLQAYKTYLISNAPRSTMNFIYYSAIVKACNALKKNYQNVALIGEVLVAPSAPKKTSRVIQGYNRAQLSRLIKCCIKDIKAVKAFHAAYEALDFSSHQIVLDNRHNVENWRKAPDLCFSESLATIKMRWPKYPYYMPMNEVQSLFGNVKMDNTEDCNLRLRIDRLLEANSGKISFMDGQLGRGAVFAAMHFVPQTIYPFFLLSVILSGFNAECLKFLPDKLDKCVEDDLLDSENYCIIYGYKSRTDRLIPIRCKKKQAFGVYKLLKYVETVVSKYKESEHYVDGVLFQFTRQRLATKTDSEGLICSFEGRSRRLAQMGENFVKRHGLESMFGSSIDARKLRSGYVTVAREAGISTRQIGEQLGHNDAKTSLPETADKHYLSDIPSVALKIHSIANIQNQFISDICNFRCRVVTSKTLQNLRDSINTAKSDLDRNRRIEGIAEELGFEEKTVVHLLDAGDRSYILACEDMLNPTWPGHEKFVKDGQCWQFNKCCLCKQAVVFPEALPLVAKRILDLEALQNMLTAAEWTVHFGDEFEAWSRILDEWNNKEQVVNAWQAAKDGMVLLPKVMRGGCR